MAVVMALGSGVLLGSVSFELIDEALDTRSVAWVGLLVLADTLLPEAYEVEGVLTGPLVVLRPLPRALRSLSF